MKCWYSIFLMFVFTIASWFSGLLHLLSVVSLWIVQICSKAGYPCISASGPSGYPGQQVRISAASLHLHSPGWDSCLRSSRDAPSIPAAILSRPSCHHTQTSNAELLGIFQIQIRHQLTTLECTEVIFELRWLFLRYCLCVFHCVTFYTINLGNIVFILFL